MALGIKPYTYVELRERLEKDPRVNVGLIIAYAHSEFEVFRDKKPEPEIDPRQGPRNALVLAAPSVIAPASVEKADKVMLPMFMTMHWAATELMAPIEVHIVGDNGKHHEFMYNPRRNLGTVNQLRKEATAFFEQALKQVQMRKGGCRCYVFINPTGQRPALN